MESKSKRECEIATIKDSPSPAKSLIAFIIQTSSIGLSLSLNTVQTIDISAFSIKWIGR